MGSRAQVMLLVSPDFRDTGSTGRGGACGGEASAEAAGQGQVAGRFSSGGPPRPVVGGSFPFLRKVAALVRQKRAPAGAHLWPTPGARAASLSPGRAASRGRARVRGPRCCGRCSSPRRQSSRPRPLFPFQLSANLPVKSSNYDDCPSAKSRGNYKLLQNPPC